MTDRLRSLEVLRLVRYHANIAALMVLVVQDAAATTSAADVSNMNDGLPWSTLAATGERIARSWRDGDFDIPGAVAAYRDDGWPDPYPIFLVESLFREFVKALELIGHVQSLAADLRVDLATATPAGTA